MNLIEAQTWQAWKRKPQFVQNFDTPEAFHEKNYRPTETKTKVNQTKKFET